MPVSDAKEMILRMSGNGENIFPGIGREVWPQNQRKQERFMGGLVVLVQKRRR